MFLTLRQISLECSNQRRWNW